MAPPKLVVPVLISIQFFFSGWHVLGKKALNDGVTPLVFALYREMSASCCMWSLALYTDGFIVPERKHWFRFLLMGVCSFINVAGSVIALNLVSAANLSMFQPTIPVFAMAMGIAFGLERFTAAKVCGLVLSLAGAVLVVLFTAEGSQEHDNGKRVLVGNIMMVFLCFFMALLLVLQKGVAKTYPHNTITAWFYSIGSLLTCLACAATEHRGSAYAITSDMVWIALGYAFLFATFYNYCAMTWTLKYVPASLVSVFMMLQPVATVVLSVFFLNYHVNGKELGGGAIVIVGLLVTCYGQYTEDSEDDRKGSIEGGLLQDALLSDEKAFGTDAFGTINNAVIEHENDLSELID